MSHDLGAIPVFAAIPRDELARLNAMAHPRTYRAGEVVVKEGEDGIGVYVITKGQFEIRHEGEGQAPQVEAVLGPGEVFGLTSMLDDGPRRASVYALTDGECLVLTRLTFRSAVSANPSLAIEVMRSLGRELRETSALLSR
jgi:CRP-like cAMP-binding protein